eukprot:9077536-Pyramimonas_sp.AAC.1
MQQNVARVQCARVAHIGGTSTRPRSVSTMDHRHRFDVPCRMHESVVDRTCATPKCKTFLRSRKILSHILQQRRTRCAAVAQLGTFDLKRTPESGSHR